MVVTCLGGCDLLFGLGPLDHQAADAPAQPTVQITSLAVAEPVAVLEQAQVDAKLHGIPGSAVVCTFAATAGGFFPVMVLAQLDANGDGQVTTSFMAPSTAGDVTIQGAVEGVSTSHTFTVHTLTTVGNDVMFSGSAAVVPDFLVGTRIQVAAPGTLRYAGVWVTSLGAITQVHLAIYTDESGAPRVRVVDLGAAAVTMGRNVYPVAPFDLTPGSYWLVGMFDQNIRLLSEGAGTQEAYVSIAATPFAGGPPATGPGGMFYGVRYAYFVTVIP